MDIVILIYLVIAIIVGMFWRVTAGIASTIIFGATVLIRESLEAASLSTILYHTVEAITVVQLGYFLGVVLRYLAEYVIQLLHRDQSVPR